MSVRKLLRYLREHTRPLRWSAKLRLRTKFLLSVIAIIAGLTFATLLIVGHAAEEQVQKSVEQDTRNSVLTFQNLRAERQIELNRSAEIFATLPAVKELMADDDPSPDSGRFRGNLALGRRGTFRAGRLERPDSRAAHGDSGLSAQRCAANDVQCSRPRRQRRLVVRRGTSLSSLIARDSLGRAIFAIATGDRRGGA